MLKKVVYILLIMMFILSFYQLGIYASQSSSVNEGQKILNSTQAAELIEMRESTKATLEDYIDRYGSKTYGSVAYVLAAVRIYSIPFCFIGIVIGGLYQYVLGIRRLDVRDTGWKMMITTITILLICQVLPLVYAIIVNGWRG